MYIHAVFIIILPIRPAIPTAANPKPNNINPDDILDISTYQFSSEPDDVKLVCLLQEQCYQIGEMNGLP